MIKILVYTNGSPKSHRALHFAAVLSQKLDADMGVITIRPGTHAMETPPPLGTPFPVQNRDQLGEGLQVLMDAADVLTAEGMLETQPSIVIKDSHKGYFFSCTSVTGRKIPFYERFGHFIECLNNEISDWNYTLLIISPPRRSGFKRLMMGDTTRKLVHNLHTSMLIVREGGPEDRYLVCADGSPSSRRQYPLLKRLLPAIGLIEFIWVKKKDHSESEVLVAEECIQQASSWLKSCGKAVSVHRHDGEDPSVSIVETAGRETVIVMGASLRHDVYRRMAGSLPMRVLEQTEASVLLVKLPPEADAEEFKEPFECREEG